MLNERQLRRLTSKWRKRLAIEDWKVSDVRYDDSIADAWADIDMDEFHERINLIRLHPECPDGEEFLICHELLHIVLRKLRGKTEDEELAINKIAHALVQKKKARPVKNAPDPPNHVTPRG